MKIKKILALILASCIIVSALALVSCSEGDGAPEGYKLVANYGDKFRLYVPTQGWSDNTDVGITGAILSVDPRISVSVHVADDAEGMSIDDYFSFSEQKLNDELENYEYIGGDEDVMLGGKNAKKYVYTCDVYLDGADKAEKYKFMNVICQNEGETYVLVYYAPAEEHYDRHLTDVEGIIENFVFDKAYEGKRTGDLPDGVKVPDGMKLVSFDEHPYLFFVPENWVINERAAISAAYFSEEDSSNVSLQMLMVSEKEIDKTVEEYFAECEEKYKEIFQSYTLFEDECGEIEMSGMKGRKYVYEIEKGGVKYKQMQAIVVRGGVFYTLTYTAVPEKFDEHLGDVKKMIESFEIR